jgi:cell division protein FtsB
LLAILLCILIASAAIHIARTYHTAGVKADQVQARQQENAAKREEIARRETRVHDLTSDQGIRDEARRTDMVLPGEHRVEVNYDVPAAPAAPQPAPTPWPIVVATAFFLAVVVGIGIAWASRRRRKTRRAGILTPRHELRTAR